MGDEARATLTAEKRFRSTLKKELGDNLERVFKAYASAAESGVDEMNEDERAFASA